jgi:hypothetical protein
LTIRQKTFKTSFFTIDTCQKQKRFQKTDDSLKATNRPRVNEHLGRVTPNDRFRFRDLQSAPLRMTI